MATLHEFRRGSRKVRTHTLPVGQAQLIMGAVHSRRGNLVGRVAIGKQLFAFAVKKLKNGKTRITIDNWHEKDQKPQAKRRGAKKKRVKRSK